MFLERAENYVSWLFSVEARVAKKTGNGVCSTDYVYICSRNALMDEK